MRLRLQRNNRQTPCSATLMPSLLFPPTTLPREASWAVDQRPSTLDFRTTRTRKERRQRFISCKFGALAIHVGLSSSRAKSYLSRSTAPELRQWTDERSVSLESKQLLQYLSLCEMMDNDCREVFSFCLSFFFKSRDRSFTCPDLPAS